MMLEDSLLEHFDPQGVVTSIGASVRSGCVFSGGPGINPKNDQKLQRRPGETKGLS